MKPCDCAECERSVAVLKAGYHRPDCDCETCRSFLDEDDEPTIPYIRVSEPGDDPSPALANIKAAEPTKEDK